MYFVISFVMSLLLYLFRSFVLSLLRYVSLYSCTYVIMYCLRIVLFLSLFL